MAEISKQLEEKIIAQVEKNRDEIIAFVQSAVRQPSVTGNEEGIAKVIYNKMLECGIDAEYLEAAPHRPNVVGHYRGEKPGKTLVFNGHMDICPPGPAEEWDFDPYSGEIKDGQLWGRGTVDMKSGTCGGTMAVKALRDAGVPIKGEVLLTCVCDEEIGSVLGTQWLINNGHLKGDFAINCEATDLKTVDVIHKGILRVDITVFGKSIHGSRPWLGINAIDKAMALLARLNKYGEEIYATRTNPHVHPATLNVGTIEGGTVPNMIPGKCVLKMNRRLVPGETKEQAIEEMRAICEQMAKDDPEFKYDLTVDSFEMPIMYTADDAPPVLAIQRAHKLVHGEDLPLGGKDAGTDASWITYSAGIPCPVYGPGDYIRYSLGPNEHIPLDDIVDAVKVYALAIYYLLGEDA